MALAVEELDPLDTATWLLEQIIVNAAILQSLLLKMLVDTLLASTLMLIFMSGGSTLYVSGHRHYIMNYF